MATAAQFNKKQITSYPGVGSVIQSSLRTRPYWFDGRFLAARDLGRDQNYFLARQAALGRSAGCGVIHGLMVETISTGGGAPDAEKFVIRAGQGLTPGGQLVMLSSDLTIDISDVADEENLDEQFGMAEAPAVVTRTRTGLFVIALRPVEFTANPITSYPTSLQGSPTTHDGSIIEATAVSLVPYRSPQSNFDATTQNAAVARQIFVGGNAGTASPSLLPVAMISLDRDAIQWIDPYLVRRDSGPEFAGLNFGLPDPVTQQAFLLQYDAQIQNAVNGLAAKKQPARFAATDYFQALPPAGRLPLQSIDVVAFTQLYFPQQTDVWLSLVPEDELPAWIQDSVSLPPIDLTLPASAYADLSVFVLVPVARKDYASLSATLKPTTLTAAVPQAISFRNPVGVLRFYTGSLVSKAAAGPNWSSVVNSLSYGYYVRRRSSPIYVTPANTTTTTTLSSSGSDVAGVTLTATVLPSAATGSVTFSDGGAALATVPLTSGVATLVTSPLKPGTHALTASYPGDNTFTGSVSAPLNLTVSES